MEKTDSRPKRRSPRRAVALPCVAVEQDRLQLVGSRIRDLSCDGMLVEARDPLRKGQRVMVTFSTPGPRARAMQAMTEVTRVVTGTRCWDSGTAVALRFLDLHETERRQLQRQLTGIPPTIPQRALRVDSHHAKA